MWELNRIVTAINRTTCSPLERTEETPKGLRDNVGHYFWDSNCGGFRLMRVKSRHGQTEEIFSAQTDAFFYKLCYAYLAGIKAA